MARNLYEAVNDRRDDVEAKWVLTSPQECVTTEMIAAKTYFLEKYFDSKIELV